MRRLRSGRRDDERRKATTPLDPQHLTPTASVNRVVVVDLPGLAVDADVRGRTAYDLLSRRALSDLSHEAAIGLSSAAELGWGRPIRGPAGGDRTLSLAGEAVAIRFGRRLGYVVAALVRGDEVNRRARPEWDDSY